MPSGIAYETSYYGATMPYTLEEVQQLIEDSAAESQTLEFKLELPRKDHDGRAEFAKDICAMANSEGGSILFGVAEVKGCASALQPVMVEAFDHARRRLQQTLSSATEPASIPVAFHEIRCNGGYILELSVDRSPSGPHRVIENGRSHFYVRTPILITEMRYDELRDAFTAAERASERFRLWRAQRVALARTGKRRWPLLDGPKAVLHVAPLESFQRQRQIDMKQVHAMHRTYVFGDTSTLRADFNLEGLLVRSPLGKDPDYKHIQIFRTGMIESIWMVGALAYDEKILPSKVIATTIRDAIRLHLRRIKDAGFKGPAIVALSLFGVDGCTLAVSQQTVRPTDRDQLDLPDFLVPDIDAAIDDVDEVARPLLDLLWQCFDEAQCNYYDEGTGKFLATLQN